MVGMLQVITWLLSFYLVVKGIEVLQIALASNKERKGLINAIGLLTLIACICGALFFVSTQDDMAQSVSSRMGAPTLPTP